MATTQQEYDGQEHSPSGTRFKTDVHGFFYGFIGISEPQAKVTYPEVKVGGSAYAVAHGQPSGDLPELTLTIRKSSLKTWEDQLRSVKGVAQGVRLELLGIVLDCSLVSEPFDDEGSPLPTRVRSFSAIYAGHDGGSDRKSNDPLECKVYLKQSSPANEE